MKNQETFDFDKYLSYKKSSSEEGQKTSPEIPINDENKNKKNSKSKPFVFPKLKFDAKAKSDTQEKNSVPSDTDIPITDSSIKDREEAAELSENIETATISEEHISETTEVIKDDPEYSDKSEPEKASSENIDERTEGNSSDTTETDNNKDDNKKTEDIEEKNSIESEEKTSENENAQEFKEVNDKEQPNAEVRQNYTNNQVNKKTSNKKKKKKNKNRPASVNNQSNNQNGMQNKTDSVEEDKVSLENCMKEQSVSENTFALESSDEIENASINSAEKASEEKEKPVNNTNNTESKLNSSKKQQKSQKNNYSVKRDTDEKDDQNSESKKNSEEQSVKSSSEKNDRKPNIKKGFEKLIPLNKLFEKKEKEAKSGVSKQDTQKKQKNIIKQAFDVALDEDIEELEGFNEENDYDNVRFIPNKSKKPYFVIGIVILIMTIIGLVSTFVFAYNIVWDFANNTKQKTEFASFIYPVVMTDPAMFENPAQLPSDTVLTAAIWDIILHTDTSKYPNEYGNITVPEQDVEYHATKLFGAGLNFDHKTLGDIALSFYYSPEDKSYIIPESPKFFSYSPKVENIKKNGDEYILTVAYISPSPAWLIQDNDDTTNIGKYMEYVVGISDNGYVIKEIRESAENNMILNEY